MKKKASGLVDTVEGKGRSIPIHTVLDKKGGVDYTSYRITYYKGRLRKRERFKTLEAAKKRGRELIGDGVGGNQAQTLGAEELRAVTTAAEILQPTGMKLTQAARTVAEVKEILGGRGTPQEAARAFVKTARKGEIKERTLGEVYKEFMGLLATEGTAKTREYKHSFRYWQDCSQRLGALAEHFKDTNISEISASELEAFLDKIPVRHVTAQGVQYTKKFTSPQGRTRNNYRTAFCTLFRFARERAYLPMDIKTEAERIRKAGERKTKKTLALELRGKVYTGAEMQQILDGLPDRWRPLAVLGAFAGIRTSEIHRLQWEDINFDRKFIEVGKDQAKMGSRRVIEMSDQLIAWLKPVSKKSGWVLPHYAHDSTLNIEFKKSRKLIPVPMIRNGFRHSYASYRIWEIGDESRVAWEMNTSVRKLHANYFSPTDPVALKEWKQVLPQN